MRNSKVTIENNIRHIFNKFGFKIDKFVMIFTPEKTYKLYDEFNGETYTYNDPNLYDVYVYGDFEITGKLQIQLDRYLRKCLKKHNIDFYVSKGNL